MTFFTPKIHEEKPFEIVPKGEHAGLIKYVVDCGHHHDKDMKGNPIVKHLVYIGFQFPEVLNAEKEPHWKGDFWTVTDFKSGKGYLFHERSRFNAMLRTWTGKESKEVQWVSFLEDLVARNHPALVTIEHNPSKDGTKTYSNIVSIKPFTGKKVPKMVGPFITWSFGQLGLEDLPSNIQRKIESSIEMTEQEQDEEQGAPSSIPFDDTYPG